MQLFVVGCRETRKRQRDKHEHETDTDSIHSFIHPVSRIPCNHRAWSACFVCVLVAEEKRHRWAEDPAYRLENQLELIATSSWTDEKNRIQRWHPIRGLSPSRKMQQQQQHRKITRAVRAAAVAATITNIAVAAARKDTSRAGVNAVAVAAIVAEAIIGTDRNAAAVRQRRGASRWRIDQRRCPDLAQNESNALQRPSQCKQRQECVLPFTNNRLATCGGTVHEIPVFSAIARATNPAPHHKSKLTKCLLSQYTYFIDTFFLFPVPLPS